MNTRILVIAVSLILLAGLVFVLFRSKSAIEPQKTQSPFSQITPSPNSPSSNNQALRPIEAAQIKGAAKQFTFSAMIPAHWQVEAVPETEALNFYDPTATGPNNLEKSQIFIRYFSANQFLTLQTVNIIERSEFTLNGRPAVRYTIQKKDAVADFPNQPAWRNSRHVVTDIRVADTNPSVFYVVAKRPDLAEETYEQFLQSLKVKAETTTKLIEPTEGFRQRITKKPFGIYITPQNSPVKPERFLGYHTGADAEYGDINSDVSVKAVAAGEVVTARTADGYGGVLIIRHDLAGQSTLVVYGHLDPQSLPPVGKKVTSGETVGILGEGGTSETDGERKHLHFAILKKQEIDLRGYVQTQAELTNWHNPIDFFN